MLKVESVWYLSLQEEHLSMGWGRNLDSSMVTSARLVSDMEIRGSHPGLGSNFSLKYLTPNLMLIASIRVWNYFDYTNNAFASIQNLLSESYSLPDWDAYCFQINVQLSKKIKSYVDLHFLYLHDPLLFITEISRKFSGSLSWQNAISLHWKIIWFPLNRLHCIGQKSRSWGPCVKSLFLFVIFSPLSVVRSS